jgi:hypothetical protein
MNSQTTISCSSSFCPIVLPLPIIPRKLGLWGVMINGYRKVASCGGGSDTLQSGNSVEDFAGDDDGYCKQKSMTTQRL